MPCMDGMGIIHVADSALRWRFVVWAFRFLVLWRWSLPIIFALLLHLGPKKQGNLAGPGSRFASFTRKGFYGTFYVRNSCAGSGDPPLSSRNHQDDIITWLLGEPKENLLLSTVAGAWGAYPNEYIRTVIVGFIHDHSGETDAKLCVHTCMKIFRKQKTERYLLQLSRRSTRIKKTHIYLYMGIGIYVLPEINQTQNKHDKPQQNNID